MIILPTRGRPESLKRFIRAYAATRASEPVLVIVDRDDPKLEEYKQVDMPESFAADLVHRRPLTETINLVLKRYPDQPYYAMVGDDVVPETEHWDKILRDVAGSDYVAWGRDTIQNENLCTHPWVGGAVARKLGWLLYPGCKQQWADTALTMVAKEGGIARYLDYVRMPHLHYVNGKAEMDETYKGCPAPDDDRRVFEKFMETELKNIVERVVV